MLELILPDFVVYFSRLHTINTCLIVMRQGRGCGVGWYVWRPGGGVGGEEQVA